MAINTRKPLNVLCHASRNQLNEIQKQCNMKRLLSVVRVFVVLKNTLFYFYDL